MKTYVKPEVKIENFTLSKHIAACAFDMSNYKSMDECSAVGDVDYNNTPSIVLFTDTNTNCAEDIKNWSIYCYTNGAEGYNTFNS